MRSRTRKLALIFSLFAVASSALPQTGADAAVASPWSFAVSGDSRNCGDVVMPEIAAGAKRDGAVFYWHLGDLRWITSVDQDFEPPIGSRWQPPGMLGYQRHAWDDFIASQVKPFGSLSFFLGIGNHELVFPKTRAQFVTQFSVWLNTPTLKAQRLKDDPRDQQVRTYYHWIRGGVDFINLDNASNEQFDDSQIKWLEGVLGRDAADASVRTVVAGMHEALPESIAAGHSMNDWSRGVESGRRVYQDLLRLQNEDHKKVYVLASHSHFFMDGIFNTEYWRTHGGVLPGWIIGTAGALRYPLPPNARDARAALTNVYGYLLATANPAGEPPGTISFQFRQVNRDEVSPAVWSRFTAAVVDDCSAGNHR